EPGIYRLAVWPEIARAIIEMPLIIAVGDYLVEQKASVPAFLVDDRPHECVRLVLGERAPGGLVALVGIEPGRRREGVVVDRHRRIEMPLVEAQWIDCLRRRRRARASGQSERDNHRASIEHIHANPPF